MKRIFAAVALTTVTAAPGLAAVMEGGTPNVGVGVLPMIVIVDPGNGDQTPPVQLVEFSGPSVSQEPTMNGGEYILDNATSDWTVLGFGVTNPVQSWVYVGDPDVQGGQPVITPDPGGAEYWMAFAVDQGGWELFQPLGGSFAPPLTLEGIFGAWGFGSDWVNWYQADDGNGIAPGSVARGFFFDAAPASESFGIGVSSSGQLGYFRGGSATVIPLPATLPLLLGGLGLLGLAARRRRAG